MLCSFQVYTEMQATTVGLLGGWGAEEWSKGREDRDFHSLYEHYEFHSPILEPEIGSCCWSIPCTWVPMSRFGAALRSD